MKSTSRMFMLLNLFLAPPILAQPVCKEIHGVLHCRQGNVDNISYRGMVELEGTAVKNATIIKGNLYASHAQLNSLYSNGQSRLHHSIINGYVSHIGHLNSLQTYFKNTANITGNCFAQQVRFSAGLRVVGSFICNSCQFEQATQLIGHIQIGNSTFTTDLVINSRSSQFIHTQMRNLYVKKSSNNEAQEVTLSEGTQVQNIEFENNKGRVWVSKGAIISGEVKGGQIEYI